MPCTLWFFDRAKESVGASLAGAHNNSDNVLMLDARKIYRKVTSKVNDFSPEQLQNLICIVNLYRGNTNKFTATINSYLETSAELAKETAEVTNELQKQFQKVHKTVSDFATQYAQENQVATVFVDALNIEDIASVYEQQNNLVGAGLAPALDPAAAQIEKGQGQPQGIVGQPQEIAPTENMALLCKALRKPQDKLIKQLLDVIATAVKEHQLNKNKDWKDLNLKEQLDRLKALQQQLSGNPDEGEPGLLHETEYFWKQAHWLQSRFPEGVYNDVEGLCKVVNQQDIEAKDWSLSPGRYVGVDAATDDDFDYEERLNEIHIELAGLNDEAIALASLIAENYKEIIL